VTILHGLGSVAAEDRSQPANAISQGFSILGDEWTLMLLRLALLGRTRYVDFAAALPISHAVLSDRLASLVSSGLFERREYRQRPTRSEYVLTQRGWTTWPILVAIWSWERRWVAEHSYDTPPLRHAACGEEITAVLVCSACGEPAGALDVESAWGPSGGWRRSVPEATTRRRSPSRGIAVEHSFYPDTMVIIGNRWSSALVGSAMLGIRRFSDFEAALGAPPSVLSGRLSQLCDRHILTRSTDSTGRADYRLTERGRAFYPVLVGIARWAERWFGVPEAPVMESTHVSCGQRFDPRLSCSNCHHPLRADALDLGGARAQNRPGCSSSRRAVLRSTPPA